MFTIQCTTCNAKLKVKNEELIGQILACPKCGGMVLVQQPEDDFILSPESPPFKKFPDILTSETESGIIKPLPEVPASEQPDSPATALSATELRTRKIMLSVLAILFLILITTIGILFTVKGNHLSKISVESPDIPVVPPQKNTQPIPNSDPDSVPAPVPTPNATPDSAVPTEIVAPLESTPDKIQNNSPNNTPIDNGVSPTLENNTKNNLENNTSISPIIPSLTDSPPVEKAESAENKDSTRLAALLAQTPEKTQPEISSTTDLLSEIEKKMPGLVPVSTVLSLDIKDRLAIPLTGLKLEKTSLLEVVRLFSSLTEIPITFDIDEMRPRGIRIDSPLTEQFDAGTVGEILVKILALLELEPVVEDRQILITVSSERRNMLSERTFDVTDLVENSKNSANPLTPESLAEILQRLIDPANDSFIRIAGNSLIVQNRFKILDETLRVLEQLRVMRNLPQQTEVVGEFLVPEAFGWDAVMVPLTLNYYQPTPLSNIFSQLESATKLHILVDHKALHRALSPLQQMKATVRCNRGTVHEVLEKLLASVDTAPLTYRIANYNTIEITTIDNARQPEKMNVEVHRFATETDETPEELARTIRSALEPDSWRIPEDQETLGRGDIFIDHPSGCLLIRQCQPIQRQIRLWLGKKQSHELIIQQQSY
jgi:DNA-directed RNA polymerase subunit RPC12/RpoP